MEPSEFTFPVLHCSLASELGDYYQDFSHATTLVEAGYHGGIDDDGVPLVAAAGHGFVQNPITTAQYALGNITRYLRGETAREPRIRAQLDALTESQTLEGEWAGCWVMQHDSAKYRWLQPPWSSSLASGNALSALLRGWELFGDSAYRESAELAYYGLHSVAGLTMTTATELWYEEYPGTPLLHVLNGHVYSLLGVLDFARVSGDNGAGERWRLASRTALQHLSEFDLGYWSIYDLRFREPANVHYHVNIHIPQLRILGTLTGESEFMRTAERWERYARQTYSRVRLAVTLRVRRFERRQ